MQSIAPRAEFDQQVADLNYGEPAEHFFAPDKSVDLHTHDFSALLLVLEGEFKLVLENETRVFTAGQCCELQAGTLHTEQTGPEGAKTLLARKTG